MRKRSIAIAVFALAGLFAALTPARADDSLGPPCTDIDDTAANYTLNSGPLLGLPVDVPRSLPTVVTDMVLLEPSCDNTVYSVNVYDPTGTLLVAQSRVKGNGWSLADGRGVIHFEVPVTIPWPIVCVNMQTESLIGGSVYDQAPNPSDEFCHSFTLNSNPNYIFH